MWLGRASAAAKLLIARGQRDLQGRANEEAVEDFDAVVTLDPELAEGWRLLAVARYQAGETAAAISDIGEALKREPRDFAALSALSRIARGARRLEGRVRGVAEGARHRPAHARRREPPERPAPPRARPGDVDRRRPVYGGGRAGILSRSICRDGVLPLYEDCSLLRNAASPAKIG